MTQFWVSQYWTWSIQYSWCFCLLAGKFIACSCHNSQEVFILFFGVFNASEVSQRMPSPSSLSCRRCLSTQSNSFVCGVRTNIWQKSFSKKPFLATSKGHLKRCSKRELETWTLVEPYCSGWCCRTFDWETNPRSWSIWLRPGSNPWVRARSSWTHPWPCPC